MLSASQDLKLLPLLLHPEPSIPRECPLTTPTQDLFPDLSPQTQPHDTVWMHLKGLTLNEEISPEKYDFICVTLWKGQTYADREQVCGCPGPELGGRVTTGGSTGSDCR